MTAVIRCRFTKCGRARFLSHLDLIRMIGRAFRRAGILLLHSGGFHPHPLLAFGPALAVGIESNAEYFDATVEGIISPDHMRQALNRVLPDSLSIDAASVPNPGPPLSAWLTAASYGIWVAGSPESLAALSTLGDREVMVVTRQKPGGSERVVDVRPLLLDYDGSASAQGRLGFLGATGGGGSLRPEDLAGMIPGVEIRRALRTGLFHRVEDQLFEPLSGREMNWRELTPAVGID